MIDMSLHVRTLSILLLVLVLGGFMASAHAQNVKRVVVVKIDGLPGYYVDRFVKERDSATGRSQLPWLEEVFYRNGTRVPNFYTRGMSLSGPSWGQIDSGRHLQIKGNVEYDRYTLHPYDYLNFFPYYLGYVRGIKADMPAAEVMDQLGIPLLSDAFPFDNRYTAHQLFQRGNDWAVLASGFVNLYPGDVTDFMNEWTIGLNYRSITVRQAERDIVGKLSKRDHIEYYDYYDTEFDHVSHHNNDTESRLTALKGIDRLIGNLWNAIRRSPGGEDTALILISDHGFNSAEKVISQGFNIVRMLGSAEGGAHHVVTKRRLMLDYTVRGLYPLTPIIRTASPDSYYLAGQSDKYPTALVDFDGNERSSFHLRNSDLNILHILLQQMRNRKTSSEIRAAAARLFFRIVSRNASTWSRTSKEIEDEVEALERWAQSEEKALDGQKVDASTAGRGEVEAYRRRVEQAKIARDTAQKYRDHIRTLRNLLALDPDRFDPRRVKIEDVIAPGAMGEPNSLFQLQNYVVGLSPRGIILSDREIDLERSFKRVNYFELLHAQKVRNNVQAALSNRPVDMAAIRIPAAPLEAAFGPVNDAVWLYGGASSQALVLTRTGPDGVVLYRYVPVADLTQHDDGKITFREVEIGSGFPLKYFEDPSFAVPASDRRQWFSEWHAEDDWLRAAHLSTYSNALIGLNEHLQSHPLYDAEETKGLSPDEQLIRRFRQRQRHLTEADILVIANNHWNFDVRGFNPGGNHGSFRRVSTNSTFMIAGGSNTGIPRGKSVEDPYDNLSFAPTLLRLMGKIDNNNEPTPELRRRGFRRFPGRVIQQLFSSEVMPDSAPSRSSTP